MKRGGRGASCGARDSRDTWGGASPDPGKEDRDRRNGRYRAGFRAGFAERMGGLAAADTNAPGAVDRSVLAAACKDDSDFGGASAAAEAAGHAAPHGTAERDATGGQSGAPGYAVRRQTPQGATRLRARQPKPHGATAPP